MANKQMYTLTAGSYTRYMGGRKVKLFPGDPFCPSAAEKAMLGAELVPVPTLAPESEEEEALELDTKDLKPSDETDNENPEDQDNEDLDDDEDDPEPDEDDEDDLEEDEEEDDTAVKHVGGGWYELPDGRRIQGKAEAEAALKADK